MALYSAGRCVMFFYRSDSEELALGLNEAQWISIGLVAIGALGAWWSARSPRGDERSTPDRMKPKARTATIASPSKTK